jgi:hypothetical protein
MQDAKTGNAGRAAALQEMASPFNTKQSFDNAVQQRRDATNSGLSSAGTNGFRAATDAYGTVIPGFSRGAAAAKMVDDPSATNAAKFGGSFVKVPGGTTGKLVKGTAINAATR